MGGLGWRCKQSLLSIIKKRIWRKNKLDKNEEQIEQSREALEIINDKEFVVRKFLFGDYALFCANFGHQGACSTYP